MKLLYLSVKMFVFGVYCDFLINIIETICNNRLRKKEPLNTKFLAFMSNLSNNSLNRWQKIEKKFILLLNQ